MSGRSPGASRARFRVPPGSRGIRLPGRAGARPPTSSPRSPAGPCTLAMKRTPRRWTVSMTCGARGSSLKSPPQLAERLRERVVRHHDVTPDGRVQLFLRDQARRGARPDSAAEPRPWAAIPPGGRRARGVPHAHPTGRAETRSQRLPGGRAVLEKFADSLGTSRARPPHDPRGEDMARDSTQARTAGGFRPLRLRQASARGNAFISRGYHVPGTEIGPRSHRRPPGEPAKTAQCRDRPSADVIALVIDSKWPVPGRDIGISGGVGEGASE